MGSAYVRMSNVQTDPLPIIREQRFFGHAEALEAVGLRE
jgi:hypothetical protein